MERTRPTGADDIVEFFDRLLEVGASLDEVLAAAAGLVGCTVGMREPTAASGATTTIEGRLGAGVPSPTALVRPLTAGGVVWLDRQGSPGELDDVVLQRLGVAVTIAIRLRDARQPRLGEAGLVEVIVSATAERTERSRALQLLGLSPTAPLHVLALSGSADSASVIVRQFEPPVRVAPLGGVHIVLASQPPPDDLAVPTGSSVGVGPVLPAIDAPHAWREARAALRFSKPSTHSRPPYADDEAVIVPADRLGAFSLLAQVLTPDAIDQVPDVQRLAELAMQPRGADMLKTLEAVAATESLRKAAAVLHVHHNSVAQRVERAEQALGFSVTAAYGRSRLLLGLVMYRLRHSSPYA